MMATLLWASSFLLASSFLASAQEEYCYALDEDPYDLHSDYTSYFEVQNTEAEPVEFEGCTARSYWSITRHGVRYAGSEDFEDFGVTLVEFQEQIVQNHLEGSGMLCDEDLELISSWTFDVTEEQEADLTPSGALEQELVGRRQAQRFPDLLGQAYSEELFRVRHTDYDRTRHSAEAHMKLGVFPGVDVYIPAALEEDPLLRPYDFCTKWIEEVKENPATAIEQELFVYEQQMLDTITNVNRRLGFLDTPLTFDDLDLMYDMCGYDRARWPGKPAAWCSPFEENDMMVLEYYQDLWFWYQGGYGNEINRDVACPQIKDLADTFNMPDDERPVGTFYFAHGSGQLLFTTALGLFEDDIPLLHNNYETNADRLFRSSLIKPYTNNFVFVLYDCDEGGDDLVRRVLTLRDEVSIALPGCDEALCLWDQFQDIYQDAIECPFVEICEIEVA